jgi:hypothetical protein
MAIESFVPADSDVVKPVALWITADGQALSRSRFAIRSPRKRRLRVVESLNTLPIGLFGRIRNCVQPGRPNV